MATKLGVFFHNGLSCFRGGTYEGGICVGEREGEIQTERSFLTAFTSNCKVDMFRLKQTALKRRSLILWSQD